MYYKMEKILLKNNLPHVVTLIKDGYFEELFKIEDFEIDVNDLILGMSELNKNGISLLDISVSKSKEGVTKIDKNALENAGIFKDKEWLVKPKSVDFLPENDIIPFKSDSWALGEFIIRIITNGKTIPKRFMKSQALMDKFIESIPTEKYKNVLQKILILDPNQREYTWNILNEDNSSCSIQ